MEGKINVFGDADVMFAVYKDNQYADVIPGKNEGYHFDKAVCTNGATATWNKTDWSVKVNSLTKAKTKCSLYFLHGEEPVGGTEIEDKIQDLVNGWEYADQIVYEQEGNDNNIRFVGTDPDNYVKFNGEDWRIIGLMDNITTAAGQKQKLLKIIRKDVMSSSYPWDKLPPNSNVNSGRGINEWSQADLMYALKKYGGDASVTKCGDSSCPSWGTLNSDAQKMVEEVVWNTGTMDVDFYDNNALITPSYMYSAERSSNDGRSSCGSCSSDTVQRTTKWTGKVGLMYPSDYGFATSGGYYLKKRKECLEISMYKWRDSANNYCYVNNWLYDSSNLQWTMTPSPDSSYSANVFTIYESAGNVNCYYAYASTYAVRPVVYLKSSVKIVKGTGSESDPYQLQI